jgi:hypothetical protein
MNPCVFRQDSLFGPLPCGREGTTYDRARKSWLCQDHGKSGSANSVNCIPRGGACGINRKGWRVKRGCVCPAPAGRCGSANRT